MPRPDQVAPVAGSRYWGATCIPERDIRKAISLLIGAGLLVSVDRDHKQMLDKNEPNKYYLAGYQALVRSAMPGRAVACFSRRLSHSCRLTFSAGRLPITGNT